MGVFYCLNHSAQSPLFAVWVVSEESGNDSPKEELTTQEAALVQRLRTAVDKSGEFVICPSENLPALSISHPEGVSGRHVFFIEPTQISGDGFGMLCQLTRDLQNTQNPQQSARHPSGAQSSTRPPEVPPIQRVLSALIERQSDNDTIGALIALLPGLLDCTQSCTPEILAQELAAALGKSGLEELVGEANNLVYMLYPQELAAYGLTP